MSSFLWLSSFLSSSAAAFCQACRDLADGSVGAVSRAMQGVRTLDLLTAALALCVSSAVFAYLRRQMWEGRGDVRWLAGSDLVDNQQGVNLGDGQTSTERGGPQEEEAIEPGVKEDDGRSCSSQESAEEVEKSVMLVAATDVGEAEALHEEQLPVSTYGGSGNPLSDCSDEFVVISENE